MSPNYHQQIEELRDWFKAKLAALPEVVLTKYEYSAGTDSLKAPHAPLTKQAFDEWLAQRNYELSYNQMCSGFFTAARDLGKLQVS